MLYAMYLVVAPCRGSMYVSRCAAALRPPANGPGSVSFRGAAGRGPPSGRKDRLRSESPGAAELFTHTRTMHTYSK